MESLRLLHISDPHFFYATWNLARWFSKRSLGNLNALLLRTFPHRKERLHSLPALANQLAVNLVVVSGDLTTTSLPLEFSMAKEWMMQFPCPVYCVPGNHDVYTLGAARKKRYYTYFPSPPLAADRVERRRIGPGWWWIGLDGAVPHGWLQSYGVFTPDMERRLMRYFSEIPPDDFVIVTNHFPLYPSGKPSHDTVGCERLQACLQLRQGRLLYLHGHDHQPLIVPPDSPNTALVSNPGSVSLSTGECHCIELSPCEEGYQIYLTRYQAWKDGKWEELGGQTFLLPHRAPK